MVRRLIVCCDGTENDSISTNNPLTNVARLARLLGSSDCGENDEVVQMVHYQTGVATGTDYLANKLDAASGRGLHTDVKRAYNFICTNYNSSPPDEIYLVGFSRGSYTVKVLAAFMDEVGVLTPTGLFHLHWLYEAWLDGTIQPKKGQLYIMYPANKLLLHLENGGNFRPRVMIQACAVWDTVSAMSLGASNGGPARLENEFPRNIRNVFHALALNECRGDFKPNIWSGWSEKQRVKQCWFLGVHSDIGGGYEDIGLANITLIWMVAQLKTYTGLQIAENRWRKLLLPYNPSKSEISPGFILSGFSSPLPAHTYKGQIADSITGIFRLRAKPDRTQWKQAAGFTKKKQAGRGSTNASTTTHDASVVINDQRIHWTVRVLLEKKFALCPTLAQYKTVIRPSISAAGGGRDDQQAEHDSRAEVAWCMPATTSDKQDHTVVLESKAVKEEIDMLHWWVEQPTYATPPKPNRSLREIAMEMHVSSRGGWAEDFCNLDEYKASIAPPQPVKSVLIELLKERLAEAERPNLMYKPEDTVTATGVWYSPSLLYRYARQAVYGSL